MGRHFTGSSGDYIDFAPGSAASNDGGPSTVIALWRPTTVHAGWLIDSENASGSHAFSINPYSDGLIWHTMVGFRSTMGYTASDGWRLDLWTKAAGTAQVRGHTLLLSGGSWSHADYGTSDDSANVPSVAFRVGGNLASSGALDADMAAMAIVTAEWDDATIEAGDLTTGLAEWMTLIGSDPAVVWAFNQAAITDPVTDVTGGGGDQTAISGTSVGDDPAGFSYSLASTDCVLSASLPALLASLVGVPASASVLAGTLPSLTAHLSIGANVPPPAMTGTAVVRGLTGTATTS